MLLARHPQRNHVRSARQLANHTAQCINQLPAQAKI